MQASESIVKAIIKRRFDEVKADIKSGRRKFYNSPPEWTEELLNITARNCVLMLLANEAKWN